MEFESEVVAIDATSHVTKSLDLGIALQNYSLQYKQDSESASRLTTPQVFIAFGSVFRKGMTSQILIQQFISRSSTDKSAFRHDVKCARVGVSDHDLSSLRIETKYEASRVALAMKEGTFMCPNKLPVLIFQIMIPILLELIKP